MSLDMKAHYESSEKNLYKNTIIVEQEINSAWAASHLKWLKKILPSESVFESLKDSLIYIFATFILFYFSILQFLLKDFGLYTILIFFVSCIILTIYTWLQYRYNNVFHRMGINPKSKKREDIQKIFNIFEVLLNNNYKEKGIDDRDSFFEELSHKIVEDSSFARYPVIDMYRKKMTYISKYYDFNLRKIKNEEIKNKELERIEKIKNKNSEIIESLIPSSVLDNVNDNETKNILLIKALQRQRMNKKS